MQETVSKDEMKSVKSGLKEGKAPKLDRITAELLKGGVNVVTE